MRINRWIAAATAAAGTGLALVVAPVVAHHSSAPFYDQEKRVEIEGKVTRFVFNPRLSRSEVVATSIVK